MFRPEQDARKALNAMASMWSSVRAILDRPAMMKNLVVAITLVIIVASVAFRRMSEWDDVYVRAAGDLVASRDIYQPDRAYVYPPFMAAAAIPFLGLGTIASRAIWYSINVGAILALLGSCWWMVGGTWRKTWTWHDGLVVAGGLIIAAPSLFNALAHHQTDILIGALQCVGAFLLLRERPIAAGVALGLAASVKGPPILWLGYLLYRGQHRASLAMVVTIAAAMLLPDLVHSAPDRQPWLMHWLTHVVLPPNTGDVQTGTWHSLPIYNQSLAGLVYRFNCMDSDFRTMVPARFSPVAVRFGLATVALLLCATAVVVSGRPTWKPSVSQGHGPFPAAVWEFSLALMMPLLFSPMSSPAHFGVLLLPTLALMRFGVNTRRWWPLVLVAGLIGLQMLSSKNISGETLQDLMTNWGNFTITTLILFLGCSFGRFTHERPPAWQSEEFAVGSRGIQPPHLRLRVDNRSSV